MARAADVRVRRYRQRAVVRAWQYRQRHHAHGVWFRWRRVLAGASAAYAISREDAETLRREGFRCDPVGDGLAPPRTLVLVPGDRIRGLASARPVPVRLGPALLSAECLALTPFDHVREPDAASIKS